MCSWSDHKDRITTFQLNAELRHAQLELLSAECATDRLRLRFSIEEVARHAQSDVLRKAVGAAAALHKYYSSLDRERSCCAVDQTGGCQLSEEQVVEGVARVASYLRQQREYFFRMGEPLGSERKAKMQRFFPQALLNQIRTVELAGCRLPNPSFYSQARELGFANLPEITHMPSLTFVDVVVFNDKLTERALFHGLVHAVQFQVLGLERYADNFVRSFIRKASHFNVPLESQAISLEARFAECESQDFSVEEQVLLWLNQGRYRAS